MTTSRDIARRTLLATAAMFAVGSALPAFADAARVRIGVQKYGTLIVLQVSGALEKRLAPLGIAVEWREFPGGPQLLEALNGGSLDFGIAGEAPPIFAQAGGVPFVYVGTDQPAPTGEAILVAKDSPIHSVVDLKGKRIAFNKGSNVHYLVVAALEKAGLNAADIEPVYLAPADGRAAFERGSVAAWAIWDPYLAAGQAATQARVLVDGTGLAKNPQFYLSSRSFADGQATIVHAILDEIAKTDEWAANHQTEVAQLLAPHTGLPLDVLGVALGRLGYGSAAITPDVIANQQLIADTFYRARLIPRAITVRDAVWGGAFKSAA
jgi:sulfonate transport system substrate-binding protein